MTPDQKRQTVVQAMMGIRGGCIYTNDWRRTNPPRYAASDCSGTIGWAYRQVGINPGDKSFHMAVNGENVFTGTNIRHCPVERLLPGDIICMGWPSVYGGRISHVEMYVGIIDGQPYTIGHGGPEKGPNLHFLYDGRLTGSATNIKVRRFIKNTTHIEPPKEEPDLNDTQNSQLVECVEFNRAVSGPALTQIAQDTYSIRATITALNIAIQALTENRTVDGDKLIEAIRDEVRQGLAQITPAPVVNNGGDRGGAA